LFRKGSHHRLRGLATLLVLALVMTSCETFGVESFGTDPGNTVELCGQRWTDAAGENFSNIPTAISRTWVIPPAEACGDNSVDASTESVTAIAELLVEAGQPGNFVSCGFFVNSSADGNVFATFGNGVAPCDEGCFMARGQHQVFLSAGTLSSPVLLAPEDCIFSA